MSLVPVEKQIELSGDSFYITEDLKREILNAKTPIKVTLQSCTNVNNNQPVINLNIIIQNNGQTELKKTGKEAKAMTRAQFAWNKYQKERKKHEELIYEVFAAIRPQSKGGKPSHEREQMEVKRDAQGKLVDQLKQDYDNALQKLDELIEQNLLENKSQISTKLIKKKLDLLNQEVSNRRERITKLDGEISFALKPVKECGFYSEHKRHLEYLREVTRNDVTQLESLIDQTKGNLFLKKFILLFYVFYI